MNVKGNAANPNKAKNSAKEEKLMLEASRKERKGKNPSQRVAAEERHVEGKSKG